LHFLKRSIVTEFIKRERKLKLSAVVGVKMVKNRRFGGDDTYRSSVQNKQKRTKNRTLGFGKHHRSTEADKQKTENP
jgi:hypothetical protein